MHIILKGIDMPKSCGGCEFNYCLEGGSYEWWECVILHDDINQFDTRRTDCPLVEIPTPHGRLIDIEKLKEEFAMKNNICKECDSFKKCDNKTYSKSEICEKFIWVPTILEAEE